MIDKAGGPAFPFGQTDELSGQLVNGWGSEGMTLRDYFAAKAIPMVADRFSFSRGDINGEYIAVESFESIAFDAYLMADAMLKEREK